VTTLARPFRVRAPVGSWEETTRRVSIALLLLLGVTAILVASWSIRHGGIGWDARIDTYAALVARSIDSSSSLAIAYDRVPSNNEFYGVFLQQFADVLHLLATASTEPLQVDDPTTYVYQGIANLILAVLAVTALAFAVALAFRSVLAGAFVWSLTLATPLWLGMEHVDFKDVPVAAGLTLVTAGLVFSLVIASTRKAAIVGALVAGSGGAFTLATRAGTFELLAGLVGGTFAVALVWAIGRRQMRAILPLCISSASVAVCALAFTWLTNPIARLGMVEWLHDSVDIARKYPWNTGPIRAAGLDLRSIDLPWWYVPAWLFAQLPLLTLAAVVTGFVVLIVRLVQSGGRVQARDALPLLPIVIQAVVLPVAIVVGGAVLYDGIRHLLFMIPALLAIAAVGLALVYRRASLTGSRMAIVLPVLAVVVVAASLAASIQWAPYAYAYLNPIAGANKEGRSWELDYWGVSGREGVRRLREAGLSPIYTAPAPDVGIPWGATSDDMARGDSGGVYVFLRWNSAKDYGCTVIFTIERGGHVLGEGARCP
jgi:hypothetical protein